MWHQWGTVGCFKYSRDEDGSLTLYNLFDKENIILPFVCNPEIFTRVTRALPWRDGVQWGHGNIGQHQYKVSHKVAYFLTDMFFILSYAFYK